MLYLQMLPSPSEKDKFEQIYTLYRGLMFYIARRILPGEADAEDAVHQAFVSIIENLKKISEVRCPKTRSYVVIITERKAIDILRSRSRLSPEAFEESTRGVELPLPGNGGLSDAMSRLPAAYREVLLLRYMQELDYGEIARALRISEGTVKSRINRAKARLKELLSGGNLSTAASVKPTGKEEQQ